MNLRALLAQYHFLHLQKFVFLLKRLLMNHYKWTLRKKYAGHFYNVRHIFIKKRIVFLSIIF